MDALQFRVLGAPTISTRPAGVADAASTEVRLTRQLQALLAYLLLYRDRSHSRDILVEVFWADEREERGRNCLTTALWRLRRAIAPDEAGTPLIGSNGGDIQVVPARAFTLDVADLEASAGTALREPLDSVSPQTVAALAEAVALYRGDLLEGFYDDWVLRERERLRLLYHRCLLYLLQYHRAHASWSEALAYGSLLLQHDPLREDVHREVMRLYLHAGQRSLAVRQYVICRDVLARELRIPPMEETEALYAEILLHSADAGAGRPASLGPSEVDRPVDLAFVLRQANAARRSLESTVDELNRLIRLLETTGTP